MRDEVDCLHPKERLGILAVEKSVQYMRVIEEASGGFTTEGKKYKCQIQVGGQHVGGVVEGVKRLNAETKAAWNACKVLLGSKEIETDVDMDRLSHQSGSDEEEWFDTEGCIALAVDAVVETS